MLNHPRILPDNPPHGLLLGWRPGPDPTSIWDDKSEGHLVTVAPTGAGKGVSAVIPALLSWRGPAVVIDPRGENYAVTAQRRRALGQEVHLLDPFSVTDSNDTTCFNPLQVIDTYSDSYPDDIAAIANLLVDPRVHRSSQDPFWTERANALIAMAIRDLFDRSPPGAMVTLHHAAQIIRFSSIVQRPKHGSPPQPAAPTDNAQMTFEDIIASVGPKGILPAPFYAPIEEFGTDRTRASIYATASSHLGFLQSNAVQFALCSGINPDDITDGKPMTIYIVVPHDKLATHAGLVRLWIGSILMAIGRRRTRPPVPTLMLIDEAAQLGELEQLRTALTLMRGYGLRMWLFFQDLSQIRRTYPADWESILNNCSTQQFFSPATPFARSLLDAYLQGAAPTEAFKGDRAVLLANGQTHIVTRTDYRADRVFAGLASSNPFYARHHDNLVPFPSSRDQPE